MSWAKEYIVSTIVKKHASEKGIWINEDHNTGWLLAFWILIDSVTMKSCRKKFICFLVLQSFHIIYDQAEFMLLLISLSITYPQASNRWEKISTHGQKNQHAVEIEHSGRRTSPSQTILSKWSKRKYTLHSISTRYKMYWSWCLSRFFRLKNRILWNNTKEM